MSYSRRAQTVRRLTGGAMLALCVGLAIERAGAQQQQQQTSAGANVNVIAGTGADGDWTLQRQNEPSIACSSRNPRNCIAGANDYRTVDIPFPGGRRAGDWRRVARLVHDQGWRSQLADPAAARVSAGCVYGRSELSSAGLCRRRRSDHSTGHERALLLRRAGLRSRRGRWQRDLRRSLHRQQQPGGNRRRADRLPRCLDCSSYWCGANRRAPPGGRSEGLDASRATRGTGQQEAKTQHARRRRTGGRADGRQTVDGRRHSASRSADVHDRRRQHWCSATDVSRRARLHGVRAFRWPRRGAWPNHVQPLPRLRTNVESASDHQQSPQR